MTDIDPDPSRAAVLEKRTHMLRGAEIAQAYGPHGRLDLSEVKQLIEKEVPLPPKVVMWKGYEFRHKKGDERLYLRKAGSYDDWREGEMAERIRTLGSLLTDEDAPEKAPVRARVTNAELVALMWKVRETGNAWSSVETIRTVLRAFGVEVEEAESNG